MEMRFRCIVSLTVFLDGTAGAVEHRAREYRRQTYAKHQLMGAGIHGSMAHLQNSPHEWGRSGSGLAKRVGSSFGTHAVRNTIAYGVLD